VLSPNCASLPLMRSARAKRRSSHSDCLHQLPKDVAILSNRANLGQCGASRLSFLLLLSSSFQDRIAAFARELAEEMGEVDDSNALSWLDAVERQAVAIGDAVSTAVLEQRAAELPTSEEESICPQCGKLGRYRGQRKRELIGRRGPATIGESEYYCPACRRSFFACNADDRG
jgi:hypothetical protein